jgi:hypothetical protein
MLLHLADEITKLMNVCISSLIKYNSGNIVVQKRKRNTEAFKFSDSDNSPEKSTGTWKKKALITASPTQLLYNNSAFNTSMDSDEIIVLARLNALISVRYYCSYSTIIVSQAETEIFFTILRDEKFHGNESLIKFYIQFSNWITVSAFGLGSSAIHDCLSIMSYILNLSFLSKNQWILCASLKIMYQLLPLINSSSQEVIELFKKLIAAYTLLLRGKTSLRSSDDVCVHWRVFLLYIKLYVRSLDLNMDRIIFNDSTLLESSRLLYSSAWNHHHFEARMHVSDYLPLLVKRGDLAFEFETITQTRSEDVLFFISTALFYMKFAKYYSLMRLSAVVKMLELVVTDYTTFLVSNLLDDLANSLGFSTNSAFLVAMIEQRLLFRWERRIETFPYILCGCSSLAEFLLHILGHSLPKIVYDSKWDILSQILHESEHSAPLVLRQNITSILVELAQDHKEMDELVINQF